MPDLHSAARVGDPTQHLSVPPKLTVISEMAVSGTIAGAFLLAGSATAAPITVTLAGVLLLKIGSEKIAETFSNAQLIQKSGILGPGSTNVYIEKIKAARACLEQIHCLVDGRINKLNEGSSKVFINRFPAARVGDKTECGAVIIEGSKKVFIHGMMKPCPSPDSPSPYKDWALIEVLTDINGVTEAGIKCISHASIPSCIEAAWEGKKWIFD